MNRLALFLTLVLVPVVLAQEDAKAPQMDDLSKKTLEAWKKKEYHLGTAGVAKCSFTIKASLNQMGQAIDGGGKYKWDGQDGTLSWDNAMVGSTFEQQGWSKKNFNSMFKKDYMEESLAGTKVTAQATDEGTVLTIEGSKDNYAGFVFDKDGVMSKMILDLPMPTGEKKKIEFKMSFQKVGDKYLNNGWEFSMEMPGMGSYEEKTTMEVAQVGDYHVITKVDSVGKMAMGEIRKNLEFSAHKFNGDVE